MIKLRDNKNLVFLSDVYHCRPIEDSSMDRSKSVEMDPESAEEARHLAESRHQLILGWYHSHPVFEVNPSNIDI